MNMATAEILEQHRAVLKKIIEELEQLSSEDDDLFGIALQVAQAHLLIIRKLLGRLPDGKIP